METKLLSVCRRASCRIFKGQWCGVQELHDGCEAALLIGYRLRVCERLFKQIKHLCVALINSFIPPLSASKHLSVHIFGATTIQSVSCSSRYRWAITLKNVVGNVASDEIKSILFLNSWTCCLRSRNTGFPLYVCWYLMTHCCRLTAC